MAINNISKHLKNTLINYNDALVNLFGEYELDTNENEDIFIKSEFNNAFIYVLDPLNKDCIRFFNKNEYLYNEFYFSFVDSGILVEEIKINVHEKGNDVEYIQRLYGKSRFDNNINALLDLHSTNYVIKGFYPLNNLIEREFLQKNSLLTTTFSAHMKHFYRIKHEIRNCSSTIYPAHVYFNGEDISLKYEYVEGIDKISRIYNLYSGNVKKESKDINIIIKGLVDEKSFNYKNRSIAKQVKELIGEKMDTDLNDKMLEEYIEQELNKLVPIEETIQSSNKTDECYKKTSSKVKKFINSLFSRQ